MRRNSEYELGGINLLILFRKPEKLAFPGGGGQPALELQ
jgi:hypothetical protein